MSAMSMRHHIADIMWHRIPHANQEMKCTWDVDKINTGPIVPHAVLKPELAQCT